MTFAPDHLFDFSATYGNCMVYVVGRSEGPVKVGSSGNVVRRVKELQPGCPFKIEILFERSFSNRRAAERIESLAHLEFHKYRGAGEWFEIPAALAIGWVERYQERTS